MSYKPTDDPGWCGDRKRGAGMGRSSDSSAPEGKCFIRHLRLVDGGAYDEGGAYWGSRDARLYMIGDAENEEKIVVEAQSRAQAMREYEDRFAEGSVVWRRKFKSVPYSERLEEILPYYIKALMFCGTISYDEKSKFYDRRWDERYCFSDFTEEAIETFRKEVSDFIEKAGSMFDQALSKKGYEIKQLGHDLGMSVAESGCGFLDDNMNDRDLAKQLDVVTDSLSWSKDIFLTRGHRLGVE